MIDEYPYPGLRPFEREETDIFFGREQHTDQLLELLGHSRFIAIIGPSGCGKSSLVRTGLLAGLDSGFLTKAGEQWRIAEMRPGNRPFANLATALLDEMVLGPAYTPYFNNDNKAIAALEGRLRRGPLSLHEILQDTPLPDGTNLLVLVDQFEEIFRYYQEGEVEATAAFVALLLESYGATLSQKENFKTNIYVVITMRSDFIGDCALFQGLPEAINQGLFLTPRLSRDQLHEAIALPAGVFGGEVAPALVNKLLNDVGDEHDQLPVVQHALMRMWTLATAKEENEVKLTLDHYVQSGGLKQALSQHADEAYEELDSAQKKIAEILFRNLAVRDASRRDTRRPIKLAEIARLAEVEWQTVVPVVEAFRQKGRNFLVPPVGKVLEPDTILDISHETLIRQWRRMQNWLNQEAEAAELYRRVEGTAYRWEQGKAALWRSPELEHALAWREQAQPTSQWASRYGQHFDLAMRFLAESEQEQQREAREKELARQRELRQTRKQLATVAIGLVVSLSLTLVAGWQWWESQKNFKRAEEQQQLAETREKLANEARAVADRNLLTTLTGLAKEEINKGNVANGILLLLEGLHKGNMPVSKQSHVIKAKKALREAISKLRERLVMQGHSWAIYQIAFSPDGMP